MKKLLSLLLALCLAVSLSVPALAATPADFEMGRLSGIAALPEGALLISDTWNKVLWMLDGDTVTRYAGVIPVEDLTGEPQGVRRDGDAASAYFVDPWDVEPFLDGYAISDGVSHTLRFLSSDNQVYTLAGSGSVGSANGSSRRATFTNPTGLALCDDGSLLVADTGAGNIRRISTEGAVTTWAEGLNAPMGIDWYDGALYVAESGKNQIVRIKDGNREVLAGTATPTEDGGSYYGGYADGPAAKAEFDHPEGVAVGEDGTVYVADTWNGAVRMIRDGRVYTLARSAATGVMPVQPRGLLVQGDTLWVTDQFAGNVLQLSIAQTSFSDVKSSAWYAAAVNAAVQRGLTSGVSATRFDPTGEMTRSMFVTMLSRLHQCADGTAIIGGDSTFTDVKAGKWYTAATQWAADRGIVKGTGGGTFSPNLPVARQQIAVMLYRYAADQGYDVSAGADLDGFSDAGAVAGWASEAMSWAVGLGLMKGADGALNPAKNATRAEVVQILIRFMDTYSL